MTIFPIAYATNMSITELPSKNKPNASAHILHYSVRYHCIGFPCQDFGSGGGYMGGFCDNLPEASPMSNGANASQF